MSRSRLRTFVLLACLLSVGSARAWVGCGGTSTSQSCSATVSVTAAPDSQASPYSITQAVSGLTGSVTHVSVTLTGITENVDGNDNLNGMELLLVSPSGKQLVILAYPAGDAFSPPPASLQVDDSGQVCGANMDAALSGAAHVLADNCNGTTLFPGPPDGFQSVSAPGSSCTATTCVTAHQPSVGMDNTFNSEVAPNGNWTLYIINHGGGATFQFTGWTLVVNATGVAATGTSTAVTPANQSVFRTTPGPSDAAPVTATVTSTSTVNTGNVNFFDNGVAVGGSCANVPVNGSGQAVCNFTTTQEGVHPITASYLGAGGFAPSSSPGNSPANVTVTDKTVVTNGTTYCNPGNIKMSGAGISMPYPSQIFVGLNGSADLTGVITNLTLDTKTDSANNADFISVLLVSPANVPFLIWSTAFQNLNSNSGPADISFADGHSLLPNSGGLVGGTFSPTDYAASPSNDQGVFPAPAPQTGFLFPANTGNSQPGGPATFNTAYSGAGATGTWSLYVFDQGANTGAFAGGWCLNFTVNSNLHPTTTTVSASPTASYTSAPFTSKFPPVPANDFVTFSSHTSSNIAITGGSVTFSENNNPLTCTNGTQPIAVDGSGNASCNTTFTAEGNHIIRATYTEGVTFGSSNNTTLERVDDHSTRSPAANTVSNTTTYQYCNPGIIHIPGFTSAASPGNPYPSNIFINDLPGTINKVTLTLKNFTVAGSVQDLTSLLVGPNQNAADSLDFFSRAGGNVAGGPVTLTFDDVNGALPTSGFTSGPGYKPGSFISPPTYPSLSPVGPYPPPAGSLNYAATNGSSTFASVYGSGNANTRTGAGTWSLYQQTVINGDTISDSNGWCLNFTVNPPAVQVTKSDGNVHFHQGQQNAQYTIDITNNGPGPTGGLLKVVDTLQSGLTFANPAFSGTDWSCNVVTQTITCTIPDVIAATNSYPTLTLKVNVDPAAGTSVTNQGTVSGGGTLGSTPSNTTTTTIDQVAHLSVTKSHTGNFSEGQQGAQFSIVVHNSNAGGPTTGDVMIDDVLPTGLTFASFSGTGWSCTPSGQDVSCTYTPVIAANTDSNTLTLNVNVAANAPASIQNSATVSGGGQFAIIVTPTSNDPVTITQLPDLTIAKSHTGNFSQGQQNAQFSLVVSNGGGLASSGTVTVSDTLPTGLTFASGTGTGWSCNANNQVVTCTDSATPIAAGGNSTITLKVNVSATAAASLQNSATVACTCTEGNANNNTSNTDTVTVTQLPDLTIAKSHSGNFTQGQQNAQFSLVVTNGGSAATTGTITVSDTLPAGLTFASGTGTGWSCSALGQAVTCTDAATPISASGTSTITLNVNVANNAASSLQNTASVLCTCSESVGNNNTSNTDTVSVGQLTDLTIAKSHSGNFSQGQQNAQFSLVVSNSGAASSGTITVTDTLPAGLTFASGSGTGWTCSANGQLVTCTDTATPIAGSGGTSTITLNVNVAKNAPASVQNTAAVACTCTESNPNNNTSNIDTVTITQLSDLTLTKSHSGTFSQGQQNAQFSLVVSNGGSAASSGTIMVTDTLPSGLTFASGSGTGWSCSANGQLVTCTDASTPISAGGTSSITLNVNVDANAPSSLQNTASVACTCNESNPNNNTSNTDTVTVGSGNVLTINVSPSGGGTTNPPTGESFAPGSVPISATPNAGYQFVNWTGGTFGNASNASTTVTMPNAPLTITANFTALPTTLNAVSTSKSGSLNARVWGFNVNDAGTGAANAALMTSFTLTQTSGAACTPVVGQATVNGGAPQSFPNVALGNLAPGGSVPVAVTIDFTGCATTARFTLNMGLSANAGATNSTVVRANQTP